MRTMSSGRPIRRPHPFDVIINGQGFMLFGGHDKKGRPQPKVLNLEHPDPLQAAAPADFNYSAQNPVLETATPYDNFTAGFGQKYQHHRYSDKHYYFSSHLDLSIDGQIMFGPYITTVTPTNELDTTNGIVSFFEIGSALYALNGRYVKKRTADTAAGWGTTSKDFGAGNAALDVIVHKQNTDSSTTYAYVALGDSDFMWKFDGTTWTEHASLYARAFALVGKELYRANAVNKLSKVAQNADPWTAGNWTASNTFYIGDNSSAITRMLVDSAGLLVIFKTDGIYALDQSGYDTQLTSDLKLTPDSTNGFWSWKFENWIHCTLNGRHFRLAPYPGLQMEPIGPEKMTENDGPVRGYITAGCGTQFAAYAGLYNPDTGHSYLMKFGAYLKESEDGTPLRVDAWHGSLSGVAVGSFDTDTFSSRKITAMHRSTIGAPAGHERLYIGCSDGTISWLTLPCTPNPTGCTSYNFHASATEQRGYLYLPYWNGGLLRDIKVIRAITTVGPKLSSAGAVSRFMYRVGGATSAYNTVGTTTLDSTSIGAASPGTRYPLGLTATLEDIGLEFIVPAASGQTVTPVVSGFALHYRMNPPIQFVCDIPILCENGAMKRDGSVMRIGADRIRALVRTACETTAGVTVVFPDERTLTMQLSHYREEQRWDQNTKQYRATVVVRMTQSDAGATDQSAVVHALA